MDKGLLIPNCWEIEKCGRERGGPQVHELGECVASVENMGHSCWAIAGTLCGGVVQGTTAQKMRHCTACTVFKLYNRTSGERAKEVAEHFVEEDEKYQRIMLARSED